MAKLMIQKEKGGFGHLFPYHITIPIFFSVLYFKTDPYHGTRVVLL